MRDAPVPAGGDRPDCCAQVLALAAEGRVPADLRTDDQRQAAEQALLDAC